MFKSNSKSITRSKSPSLILLSLTLLAACGPSPSTSSSPSASPSATAVGSARSPQGAANGLSDNTSANQSAPSATATPAASPTPMASASASAAPSASPSETPTASPTEADVAAATPTPEPLQTDFFYFSYDDSASTAGVEQTKYALKTNNLPQPAWVRPWESSVMKASIIKISIRSAAANSRFRWECGSTVCPARVPPPTIWACM